MKKFLSAAMAVLMAASLAACGGSSEGNTGNSGDKTLSVAIWDNNQLKGLQKITDEWSETSGYDVEFQVLDWSSYWTMLEAGVSGGEMPDVFWMHSGYAQMYQDSNVLLPLNDYIDNDEAIDLSNYYEGITNLYSKDGTQYALPKDHDTIAIVYNKTVFDKYGVDYPTDDMTWEDFAAKAQEITEKGKDDNVYGTYMNTGSNQLGWYNVIYAFGGEVISEDHKTSGMDNENTIKAMNFVGNEILPACPSQDSMANTAGDTMLVSGKIGMYMDGSWMVSSYAEADNKDELGFVQLPYEDVNGNGTCEKEERVSIYNGLGWSIYQGTDSADAAYSLISALSSQEGQRKQSENGVTMAGYIGESEAWTNSFDGMDVTAFTKVEEEGTLVFRPYSKYLGRWEDNFTEALIPAWNDPSLMTETLKTIAADMNATLAEE